MSKHLNVEVVSPDRRLWSGEALSVSARTVEGDIGILPDHSPLLGVLVDGQVVIKSADGQAVEFTINGGFLTVGENRVSILGQAS